MARKVMQRNYDNEGNLISKECSCCHKVKPVSEFNRHKRNMDGLQSECKECRKKYREENKDKIKEYREENKEYIKQYYKDNKEYIKEYKKQYYKDNKEYYQEYNKQHYKDNKEYYQEYREKNKEYYQEYNKQHYKDDKEYYQEYRENNKEYLKEYRKEYNIKKIQEALQQIKIEVETNPEKYNYTEGKDIYGIIYLVHNINSDRYYIGQTTVGFDIRYKNGWLKDTRHNKKDTVKEDLELYGEESFEYTKIFKVAHNQHELDRLEAYYIDYYNSYENGYNNNRGNIFTDRGKEK